MSRKAKKAALIRSHRCRSTKAMKPARKALWPPSKLRRSAPVSTSASAIRGIFLDDAISPTTNLVVVTESIDGMRFSQIVRSDLRASAIAHRDQPRASFELNVARQFIARFDKCNERGRIGRRDEYAKPITDYWRDAPSEAGGDRRQGH